MVLTQRALDTHDGIYRREVERADCLSWILWAGNLYREQFKISVGHTMTTLQKTPAPLHRASATSRIFI